ncbi:MAG: hypothetical protein LBI34_01800 [Puniceicoccales bacterium]|jgi:hypothetical protein|nr:hypothetical protein [Puniceicoccales bacterium]
MAIDLAGVDDPVVRKAGPDRPLEIPSQAQIVDKKDENKDKGRVFACGTNGASDPNTPMIQTLQMRAAQLGRI